MASVIKTAEPKHCAFCGKLLARKRFNGRLEDFGVFKRRKYCDKECMKKGFIVTNAENQTYRISHQSAIRIAYNIMNIPKVCSKCGSTTNIDIHHIDGNFRNNSTNNLVALCRSCHMKEHRRLKLWKKQTQSQNVSIASES